MTKVYIVAWALRLMSFLFLLPNYINVYPTIMQQFSYIDKGKVLQQEYSQPQKRAPKTSLFSLTV